MALPNPLPDNPLKWDGWKNYNSANPYDRLCLSYTANATAEVIEDHCRQMLVWWQKKLPLKNQPSNPIAQLLRQGLDDAPHFLAEARAKLLDPEERKRIDVQLHSQIVTRAIEEFKKLLGFTLADKRLTRESEEKLYVAGEQLGLGRSDIEPVIADELKKVGAVRVVDEPPPQMPRKSSNGGSPAVGDASPGGGDPSDEFRRILKMSRLCLDGEEMSDDQRDAMCNLGESLGLTGGEAEDLIDEYLEEMASQPPAPVAGRPVAAPGRTVKPATPAVATTPKPSVPKPVVPAQNRQPVAVAEVKKEARNEQVISPAARVLESQKNPKFVNSIGGELFFVPSGRFVMGCKGAGAQPNEEPLTPVVISGFHLSRFPITNEQYEMFDPSHASKRAPWADGRHPVVYVSWHEAEAFCAWLGKREGRTCRLPTEAEWEYAARGEEGRGFPWGSWVAAGQFANFADARTNFTWRDATIDDGFAETSPVGSFPRGASPFGIEDMAGNVFEWCMDWYEPYKGKELTNPRPSKGGKQRVYRGGSWRSRSSSLRTTARAFNEPGYLSNDVGFRILCECS